MVAAMADLAARLAAIKDRGTLRITTRGRRTGKPHTVTIWFVVDGVLWVLPVVAIAGILYWLFGSGKLPVAGPMLAIAYLVGLPLGLFFPPAAMGAVAGTAAGHAWREPGARTLIAVLVIFLMLVAAVELPLAAATVNGPLFK